MAITVFGSSRSTFTVKPADNSELIELDYKEDRTIKEIKELIIEAMPSLTIQMFLRLRLFLPNDALCEDGRTLRDYNFRAGNQFSLGYDPFVKPCVFCSEVLAKPEDTVNWTRTRQECCQKLVCVPCSKEQKKKGRDKRCVFCRGQTLTIVLIDGRFSETFELSIGYGLSITTESTVSELKKAILDARRISIPLDQLTLIFKKKKLQDLKQLSEYEIGAVGIPNFTLRLVIIRKPVMRPRVPTPPPSYTPSPSLSRSSTPEPEG